MRVGQKNKLTYRWARKGWRPRAAHDQRTQSTYLFGAVCPERGTGAALVLPFCNTEAMQLHLDEIAARVVARLTCVNNQALKFCLHATKSADSPRLMAPIRRTHRAWPVVVRSRTSRIEMREVPFEDYDSPSATCLRPALTAQKVYQLQSFRSEVC
jgi:hypothetical protein